MIRNAFSAGANHQSLSSEAGAIALICTGMLIFVGRVVVLVL